MRQGQAREVELRFVCRIHNRASRIRIADRGVGYAFVDNVCSDSTEMSRTAAVGDGKSAGGLDNGAGGTYKSGR